MPRQVDHGQRRREIARGVFAVIAEKGMAAVSLRSVASAAGISMGRVQHYFATKDEMVHHACEIFLSEARSQYEDAPDPEPDARRRHLLTMGIPGNDDQRIGSTIWYSFVITAVNDPVLARIIGDGWAQMAAATDHEGLPDSATEILTALVDGLSLRVMVGQMAPERARGLVEEHLHQLGTS